MIKLPEFSDSVPPFHLGKGIIHLTQGNEFDTSLSEVEPVGDEHKGKQLTPADFGFGVTIGIAGKSFYDQCIVLVSDRRVSLGSSIPAADNAMLKELFVAKRWRVLIAGDDIGPAQPIVDRVRAILKHSGDSQAPNDIRQAFREAYQQERRQQLTDEILSSHNLSIEDLKRLGHQTLGPEFPVLSKAVRTYDLGVECLVCGFDDRGIGQLFRVVNPGVIRNLGQMDYWAIGSGIYHALATLTARPIGALPVTEVIYRCCEAKFVAESADGVGPDTTVHVMSRDGLDALIGRQDVDQMRQAWKKSREEPAPKEIITLLGSRLSSKIGGLGRVLRDD